MPWDPPAPGALPLALEEAAPFAFSFSPQDGIVAVDETFLERERRREGVRLMPVVVNDVVEGGQAAALKSSALLERLLGTSDAAAAHARELLGAALLPEAAGLELDYERVPPALWERYSVFVAGLASELHKRGKRLHLDLEAGPLFSAKGEGLAYWGELARHADRVNLMCYYERGAFRGSPEGPGPGASLAWLEEAGRRALRHIPAEKLSLAFSLAGSDWTLPLDSAPSRRKMARLHQRQVRALLARHHPEVLRDRELGAPYFRYVKDGAAHEVWFEDTESLSAKAAVARKLGITHISIWYLGSAGL